MGGSIFVIINMFSQITSHLGVKFQYIFAPKKEILKEVSK